jgi:hypothetical protein
MGSLLICDVTAAMAGVGGLALLSIFTGTLLGLQARDGNGEVKCNCFGKLPILSTAQSPVARNCAFAGLIIAGALAHFTIWGCLMFVASGAILACVVGWLVAVTTRRRDSKILLPGDHLPLRIRAHFRRVRVRFGTGNTVLLFLNSSCDPCQYLIPRIRDWEQARPAAAPNLIVCMTGAAASDLRSQIQSPVIADRFSQLWDALNLPGRPAALIVNQRGRLARPAIFGAVAILEVLNGSYSSRHMPAVNAAQKGHHVHRLAAASGPSNVAS